MPTTPFRLGRRTFVSAAVLSAVLGAPAFAQAPLDLKILAPAAPGGGWDSASRSLQQALTTSGASKSVQVVNVPGAVPRLFQTSGPAQKAGRIDGSTPVSKLVGLSVQSRTKTSSAGATSLKKT